MNRNGLSAIVATIMIILLTVSAAGIIMGFVVPFVRDGLQESTECVAFQEYYKFNEDVGLESGTNCYLSNN
jgi:flagellin-like protein